MNIYQLRYYIAVVEEGTISAAARKLNLSQPPLSTQIKLLEEEVGTELFIRGARQITLTPAGRRFYQYALEMTDIERQALEEIRDMGRGGTGTVHLGCISSAHVKEVYEGLDAFHRQYPLVRLRIVEGNTLELEEKLARNELDAAFVRTPETFKHVERLPLRQDPMMASGKRAFFSEIPSHRKLIMKDLAACPLILYKRWEARIRDLFSHAGRQPQIVGVADDLRTCLMMADYGLGISVTPLEALRGYPHLTRRVIAEKGLVSTLELVLRKDAYISASAKALFTVFKERDKNQEE